MTEFQHDTCVLCGDSLEDNYGGVGPVGHLCTTCWTELPEPPEIKGEAPETDPDDPAGIASLKVVESRFERMGRVQKKRT